MNPELDLQRLRAAYLQRRLTPLDVIDCLLRRWDTEGDRHGVWISRFEPSQLRAQAQALLARDPAALPLWGVPFAVKDNIDVAGLPTTAACPAFAYQPARHATVVQRLVDAGAIPVGKTNLDQFATGLNGTRSPYGICRNAFDPAFISGGSSSGSAVAVALGQVSFALGTDTAGSGRVPAAFNHIVGHKPTRGVIPTTGVVPACRTLDCVSIFALTAEDAARVLAVAQGPDGQDPYATRSLVGCGSDFSAQPGWRLGVPRQEDLDFFGNAEAARLYGQATEQARLLGAELVTFDLQPFLEVARLLYEGPWVAERHAAIRAFFDSHAEAVIEPVRQIIAGARRYSATDAFEAQYRLQTLRMACDVLWHEVDVMLLPTAGTVFRIDQMLAEPVQLNSLLGRYTNFVNLLDLAATAVPAGLQDDGLPFGVTLIAPAQRDAGLLRLAARLHRRLTATLGATGWTLPPEPDDTPFAAAPRPTVQVAVFGAHLSGLPLNGQLLEREGRLVAPTRTAPRYRLYALPDGRRPGLVRVQKDGRPIECELWEMPATAFGSFVDQVAAPLAIGKVELDDGRWVNGFVCEAAGIEGAIDITAYGGWRAWLARCAVTL
ncbi:MAG: allophanate hydrolase [Tepidimonas sp.]|nr:allophanate hydrolase [Tepidimonas sp.]